MIRKARTYYIIRLLYRCFIAAQMRMLVVLLLLLPFGGRAQTGVPVTVTGFTADVIANDSLNSTTADIDGVGYYLLNQSFTALGTPTYYLPNNGVINSAATGGVSFQLAAASVNNSLRLPAVNASGILTLATPQPAGTIYLLATSGSGASTLTITVKFTDSTSQVFTGQNVPDWYDGSNYAIRGIGLTDKATLGDDGNNPRLYQLALALGGANYTKPIAYITCTKTNTTGVGHVLAVSLAAPCTAPAAQPSSLIFNTVTAGSIGGSFTAASPAADAYLVVRYPAGAAPVAPVNGTVYATGATLGTGTVVQSAAATSFTATGLPGAVAYDFYVYAYNNTGCIGPVYNAVTPLTGSQATVCNGPGGVIPVGPGQTYTTITAALAAVSNGVSSSVVLELQSNYTSANETFPINIPSNSCFSASRTLTIRPAAGANGLKIIDTSHVAAFYFNGASYVTIDGRPGGTGSSIAVTAAGSFNSINLNIIDTTTAGVAIKFDNGASNNLIQYCDLQGRNTVNANVPSTAAGVLYFGNGGANGNDNNTIDHCNIHSTGAGSVKPSIGIYSLGYINQTGVVAYQAQFNDANTISNCNIYDYYAAGNAAGLELNYGNTGWTIAGNSFFQTEPIAVTSSATSYNRAIWLIPYRGTAQIGNGFLITGNYIGGSAPGCGGTAYTLASGSAGYFEAMRLELADAATPQAATSIQGNVINNIAITTSSTSDPFHGMNFTGGYGNVNVGTVTGNQIGTGGATGGITITNTGASPSHGIITDAAYTLAIKNNTIANILLTAAGNYFSGIFVSSTATAAISNNLISNINLSNTGTTTGRWLHGIRVPGGSPTVTIANNIIQGLNCNYATTGATASQVAGIYIGTTTANVSGGITGNTIRNLSNATQSTATGISSALMGICMNASGNTTGSIISGNIIDSLVLTGTSTSAAVNVIGLYINGTTSVNNTIAKNFIHTLDVSAANTGAIVTGIQEDGGTCLFSNNMIRLGIKPDGTAATTAFTINGILAAPATANSFYHNSIYIGGTGVGTTATNTYAFRRSAASGAYDIRDNIFANTRSNAGAGGKHYSIAFAANTGVTANYNVYQYNGTGGMFTFTGAIDIAAYNNSGAATPGWIATDVNSISGNPNFINPNGSVSAVNLHIGTTGGTAAEAAGIAIAAITDDIDGETRSGLTPVDIGADAGNFVPLTTCAAPGAPTGLVLTAVSSSKITGSFTAPVPGADGYLVVRYLAGATPVAPVNGTPYTAGNTLGAGTIIANTTTTGFTDSTLVAATTYHYYVYAYSSNNCLGAPKYSTPLTGSQTTPGCSGPSGLITVGPSGTYTTLTAALAALSGGIGGPVIVELQSDYVSTGETFPITIGSSSCFSPTNTITIRPAANANGLLIRSANAGPTIDFSGGNYVTIDGRPGGTGSAITVTAAGSLNTVNLNIVNTSTTGAAIRFDNGASKNVVKYCDLQGQNTTGANVPTTLAGVVYFGSNGASGNDNNLLDHCNIHGAGTGTAIPSIGVYALGAANNGANNNFNDNDTISNCNIYDYFLASGNSCGIELNQGVNGWVITGNSLFQTSTRTFTATAYNRGIWAIPNRNTGSVGNGFIITNNYIGGTAPACGGTPYSIASLLSTFTGIRLEVAEGAVVNPSLVQNNTITNLSLTGTSTNDPLNGIVVSGANGNVNIVGNTIGAATGNGAITISAGSGAHTIAMLLSPGSMSSVINVKKNIIGSITISSVGHFSGIFNNALGTLKLDSNLVGSVTTANSIYASNTSATNQFVRGINISSASATISINGNTIANLTNNSISTSTTNNQVAGINVLSTTAIVSAITGNTVRNLTTSVRSTAGATNAAVLGIGMGATTDAACTISGNTVHSLATDAATAVIMEGIFFNGAASAAVVNTISKNVVHSLEVSNTANTVATIRGIECNQGKVNIVNNMVRLGIKADGTSLTNAVQIDGILKGTSMDDNIWYNSVYIGGDNVGAAASATAAFHRTVNGTDDVRNNIFFNARSNASTGGTHYAVLLNATTGTAFQHNLYQYTGAGGAFASVNSGASTTAVYTSGWNSDNTSIVADPKFINAAGAASVVDLHIRTVVFSPANGAAVPVTAVADDIDGDTRDNTIPDIGADEFTQVNGIDMKADSLIAPVTGHGCYGQEAVVVKIRNNSATAIDFTVNPVTVTVYVSGAVTDTISTVVNTGTLGGDTTMNVLFAATDVIDMHTAGTYTFMARTSVAGDIIPTNDAMAAVNLTKTTLQAGTISVSQTNYCFTGAPTLTMANANGYTAYQWQQSAASGTGFSNLGSGTVSPFTVNAVSQTTYYRLMATCLTDTVYSQEVQVMIHNPQITATTPASRCDAGKLIVQASATTGAIVNWYADSTTTTKLASLAAYTTPALSATTTYYVSASEGGCESPRTAVTATVNTSIAITASPVSRDVCPGATVTFTVAATGSALNYQWRKDQVNLPNATGSSYTITGATAAAAGLYDVIITNACGREASTAASLTVSAANTWIGATSSDWNTAANWCGGVPSATTDVAIDAGTLYSPVVSGTAAVHNLIINGSALVTVNAGGTLNVYGNYTSHGTLAATAGTVAFRGGASQLIDALTAGTVVMNGTGGVVLNGHLGAGALVLTNGNITLGDYKLYLGSAATGSVGSHVVTNGTGSVICSNLTTAVSIPVGPSAVNYNPVIISNGQGLTYQVSVATGIIAPIRENDKAVNRTWTVTSSTTPASPVNITLQYADADVNAACVPTAAMDAGLYNGITWNLVSPDGGVLPTGTSTARLVTLASTQVGSIVIGNKGAVKIPVHEFKVQLLPTVVTGGTAKLRMSSPKTMKIEWTITDMTGSLVKRFNTQLISGVTDVNLSLPGLSKGVYQLRGVGNDGSTTLIRFMVQ
jgi:hypothetical protein